MTTMITTAKTITTAETAVVVAVALTGTETDGDDFSKDDNTLGDCTCVLGVQKQRKQKQNRTDTYVDSLLSTPK